MLTYTLRLEVATDPTNPDLRVLQARRASEAIMFAEHILDTAPATLHWTSATLRDENGAVIWNVARDVGAGNH